MARGLTLALALALLAAPAAAHGLRVFAWVDSSTVVVEGGFSTGARARGAEVRVLDAQGALIRVLATDDTGTARFPLDGEGAGLTIEMTAGDGHDGYWVLTPEDIARGAAASD